MKNSVAKKIRRRAKLVVLLFLSVFMTACAATELEERCFPILAMAGYRDGKVTYGVGFPRVGSSGVKEVQVSEIQVPTVRTKSFEKSKSEYESHLNKVADYNHLKVIVLEKSLIEQTKSYEEMLGHLAKTEEFPRNTYVCVVEDIERLKTLEKTLPQELGSYLEEYLNHHESKKGRILTLGDLMDEKENHIMILYLPYLKVEDTYVSWGGYYTLGLNLPPVQF